MVLSAFMRSDASRRSRQCRELEIPDRLAEERKRVLIVGAGPSGLSAAYHLARLGHTIEITEARPVPGGMMHFGIPAYRLPRADLMSDIRRIEAMGVRIVLNHKVEDVLAERGGGRFDAVFVAIGAHASRHVDIPARDAATVLDARCPFCATSTRERYHASAGVL